MAGMTIEDMGLPGLSSKLNPTTAFDGYTVKYLQASLDDPGDVFQLQEIETKSLLGKEVVLLDRDKFVFMDKYVVVLRYMEKTA